MKAKFLIRTSARAFQALAATLVSAGAAAAQALDLGQIATGMTGQAVEGTRFITVGAFLLGVSLVIGGFLKFYAHSKSPNDPSSSISTGFVLILCGACLVALPSLLSSGVATIFGASADVTNGTTGFIRID
ncbi:DUF6750 family protein [Leisingera caerulea]|uniref:DUF6750 family protein n=1 Tax=Leisingera caerulea TaxID=506591 RepID=UPI0004023C8B|nr:DUF6750 family protein [Leisingera caerulea]